MPAETHRNARAVDVAEILDLVRDAFVENLGPGLGGDPERIDATTSLSSLGVDDLTLIDVIESIEEEISERTIGATVGDEELGELETIGDVVELVVTALETRR